MKMIAKSYAPLETVPAVDLRLYAGQWYEIAAFPQRFQQGCHCTRAVYSIEKNYVKVFNSCRKNSADGKLQSIVGKAFPVKGSNNAKLKVQFFWPFKGDYWIIALGENYDYAMVGHPNRQYLWILSRTPTLEESIFRQLVETAQEKKFDVSRLVKTDQSCR